MEHIIAAIASAPGESAIGIVRVSGYKSIELISSIFKSKDDVELINKKERMMHYGHIVDGEKVYDEVLAVYFKGPKSYTKEDMVEIFAHGSYISLVNILNLIIKKGATPARAGEFTKRAFLNGRIDLSQAEAVMDMISSKTKIGFEVALNQLEGHLSKKIDDILHTMTDILAQIEVVIDYPDEEVEVISNQNIKQSLKQINNELQVLVDSYDTGKIIKEGLNIVIIGRPNVGKSSLLNALVRQNRAIVTDIAGTTRDIIEEHASIKGIPIKLVDTAGIRETDDMIEKIGVEKTKAHFNQSDMALIVFNASEPITKEDEHILDVIADKKVIIIINKVDLKQKFESEIVKQKLPNAPILYTSALNDVGIDKLENLIVEQILSGAITQQSNDVLTNARHYQAVNLALDNITNAEHSLEMGMPLDIVEVDLMDAYNALGEVTGKSVHEDVINRIFEKFCLGK